MQTVGGGEPNAQWTQESGQMICHSTAYILNGRLLVPFKIDSKRSKENLTIGRKLSEFIHDIKIRRSCGLLKPPNKYPEDCYLSLWEEFPARSTSNTAGPHPNEPQDHVQNNTVPGQDAQSSTVHPVEPQTGEERELVEPAKDQPVEAATNSPAYRTSKDEEVRGRTVVRVYATDCTASDQTEAMHQQSKEQQQMPEHQPSSRVTKESH